MPTELVVTRAFGNYKVGDRITDSEVIAKIMTNTNHGNVVAVNPTPAPSPVPIAPVG